MLCIYSITNNPQQSPLYAVSLVNMTASQNSAVALLRFSFGDIDYEFQFEDEERSKKFFAKAKALAEHGNAEEVRKKLGHEHLLNHTKSLMFAEKIALKKVEDQPEPYIAPLEALGAVNTAVF